MAASRLPANARTSDIGSYGHRRARDARCRAPVPSSRRVGPPGEQLYRCLTLTRPAGPPAPGLRSPEQAAPQCGGSPDQAQRPPAGCRCRGGAARQSQPDARGEPGAGAQPAAAALPRHCRPSQPGRSRPAVAACIHGSGVHCRPSQQAPLCRRSHAQRHACRHSRAPHRPHSSGRLIHGGCACAGPCLPHAGARLPCTVRRVERMPQQ